MVSIRVWVRVGDRVRVKARARVRITLRGIGLGLWSETSPYPGSAPPVYEVVYHLGSRLAIGLQGYRECQAAA